MYDFQKQHFAQMNSRIEYYRKQINYVVRNYDLTFAVAECFITTLKNIKNALQTNERFVAESASKNFETKTEAETNLSFVDAWIETMQKIETGEYYLGGW